MEHDYPKQENCTANIPDMTPISNSQADKLGEQLRVGKVDRDALQKLNEYRSSFLPAYKQVEHVLTETLGCVVTGRPSKSTIAIVEKLKRESIRLPQIQDIAGCRILVRTLRYQDRLREQIELWLPNTRVEDRRANPSNGYRALHLIPQHQSRRVEIQVRTRFQHAWAEISEKLADRFGQEVKYGKGPDFVHDFLGRLSVICTELDEIDNDKVLLSKQTVVVRAAKGAAARDAKKKMKELSARFNTKMLEAKRLIDAFNKVAP